MIMVGGFEVSELGWSGTELGSSGEMSGVELEGEVLGDYGIEVGYFGEMSGGNGGGKLEGYQLGEKLFSSEYITKVCNSVGK